MKRFGAKIALLAMPFAIAAAVLTSMPYWFKTSYSIKRDAFVSKMKGVQTLILGSSTAYYGIDPKHLTAPAFNLAYRAQSLYHDQKLLEKYAPTMPALKRVWLTFTYLTLGTQQYDLPQGEVQRSLWYLGVYGIDPPLRRPGGWTQKWDLRRKLLLFETVEIPVKALYRAFTPSQQAS